MGTLVLKELRSLFPFLCLVLFFSLLNWCDVLFTEFPDQYPLSTLLEGQAEAILLCVLGFALAASLLVREADDGTLAFLDPLPVSRSRIFWTKTALGLAVLWLLPFFDLVLRCLLYSWSRTSLETEPLWMPLFSKAILEAASCFVYLSIGLAFSFLRRFSLLLLGLIVWVYLLLLELQVPYLTLFNIFTLSSPSFHGRSVLWPTSKLAVQFGIGTFCLGIAFMAFHLTGDPAQRLSGRIRRRRGLVIAGGVATALAVVTWFGLGVYWASKNEDETEAKVRYAGWSITRARTGQFHFLYPENRAGLVAGLMDQADAIATQVREALNAKPIQSIVADLNGSSPHTAGVAHWKEVRLDLEAVEDAQDMVAIFAHETTHVYIDGGSEGRVSDHFNSTRIFHEGLASYVEYHLFRGVENLPRLRRVAAVAGSRHQLRFEDLFDNDGFSRKYDCNLVYPLGEVFIQALVRCHGEDAPGKVVQAFARPNAPKGLTGVELWRDNLQSWGANLSEVEDQFFAELKRAAANYGEFVESLPRLRGVVDVEGGEISIRVTHKGIAPGTLVCRLRPSEDTPERLYENIYSLDRGLFRVGRERYQEGTFWYQVGWIIPGASQAIYEPWVQARLQPGFGF